MIDCDNKSHRVQIKGRAGIRPFFPHVLNRTATIARYPLVSLFSCTFVYLRHNAIRPGRFCSHCYTVGHVSVTVCGTSGKLAGQGAVPMASRQPACSRGRSTATV